MEQVRLVFDPELGITAAEFVRQWCADSDLTRQAQATLERAPRAEYGDADWIAVLAGILLGVPSNALWDAIKYTYGSLARSQRRESLETEFLQIKQPDGTEITVLPMKR